MPPKVLDPSHDGETRTKSYYFSLTNGHGTHAPTSIDRWRVTVTTKMDGGGTKKTQTSWSTGAIASCVVAGLPADNLSYYGQIEYYKWSNGQSVGPYNSTSVKFKSLP